MGAPGDDLTGAGDDAGSAYVFTFDGSNWIEQARLIPDDSSSSAGFGTSVALSGDTFVGGAMRDDLAGSAYVFLRDGSSWSENAKLRAGGGQLSDWFGYSAALDDTVAVIGAWGHEHSGVNDAGAVYVFDCVQDNDCDDDSVLNHLDNCAQISNADQLDVDDDGHGDVCDNCIHAANADQGIAIFDQTLLADDESTFRWDLPVEVVYIRGSLTSLSAYDPDVIQALPLTASLVDVFVPLSDEGVYYLVRPRCLVGSWQTAIGAEPDRDQMLP